MCFAPYVSLSVFVIEFLLALYFLLKSPRDKFNRIIALLSFLLGFYQLNEFLICVTGHHFFTKLAMATTAVLPALGVSYALIMCRKKIRYYWHFLIYSPAVFFIIMFIMAGYFSESAICRTVFIEYPTMNLLGDFYALYYSVYIIGIGVLFYLFSKKAPSRKEKLLLDLGMLSMFVFTVPTLIFLIFLPMMYSMFPSVLCEFALLLAIEFIVMLWYKDKNKIKY